MFSESLPHLGGGKITDGIQFTLIIVIFFSSSIGVQVSLKNNIQSMNITAII